MSGRSGSRACSGRSPPHPPLLLQAAAERVVRVVVRRRDVEHRAELGLSLVVAVDAEVRDPERLADRRLVRLAPLRLLQRHGGLGGHALLRRAPALLEEAVGLLIAHRRYGKFSSTKSSGSVKSRVFPISIADTLPRIDHALERGGQLVGGPGRSAAIRAATQAHGHQRRGGETGFAGSSSTTRIDAPALGADRGRRAAPRLAAHRRWRRPRRSPRRRGEAADVARRVHGVGGGDEKRARVAPRRAGLHPPIRAPPAARRGAIRGKRRDAAPRPARPDAR